MWEPWGLLLEEIGAGWFGYAHSRCSPSKRGSSLQGPSNFCDAHFGITFRLRQHLNSHRWQHWNRHSLSFFFLFANVTTTDHYKYIQTNIETFRIVKENKENTTG
jgi:hypothetical protein